MSAIVHLDDRRSRGVPQATESEQYVLGAGMARPDAMTKISLDEADFFRRDHQLIFRAMRTLESEGKPCDAVMVGDWLHGQDLNVDPTYVVELQATQSSAANIVAHAMVVRDRAVLRRVLDVAEALQTNVLSGGRSSVELVDGAVRELMSLGKGEHDCDYSLKQAVRLAWDDAELASRTAGELRGVPTGYRRMDERLGGWHPGDLIFVGARPSMGKTALMVNLALNAARQGFAIGMVSGEQSAMQVGQRSIAAEGNVPAERLRNGQFEDEDWSLLTEAMRDLGQHNVRIYDRSAPTLDEVCRVARRWKQEFGIKVLFVDYLQRIRVPGAESRIEEVSETARGLKTLARDLEIPIVALAQVKAEVDKRNDKRPGLGDIANSDEATREADMIVFLYRDEVYNDTSDKRGVAELNVEKYRHGPTGRFTLRFVAETMRFSDVDGRFPS